MEKIINIDFHAHVLPGMDHGCQDVNMALEQLRRAADAGVDTVVATPHFYAHTESVEHFLERRRSSVEELKKAMHMKTGLPSVLVGAEVLICPGLEHMEKLKELCLEGTDVLLLEMPFAERWENELIDTAVHIKESGICVVLAHAERYRLSQVHKLTEQGFPLQLNVSAMAGGSHFFRAVRCLQERYVVALGSDIHGLSDNYDKFKKVMKHYGATANEIQGKTAELIQ